MGGMQGGENSKTSKATATSANLTDIYACVPEAVEQLRNELHHVGLKQASQHDGESFEHEESTSNGEKEKSTG